MLRVFFITILLIATSASTALASSTPTSYPTAAPTKEQSGNGVCTSFPRALASEPSFFLLTRAPRRATFEEHTILSHLPSSRVLAPQWVGLIIVICCCCCCCGFLIGVPICIYFGIAHCIRCCAEEDLHAREQHAIAMQEMSSAASANQPQVAFVVGGPQLPHAGFAHSTGGFVPTATVVNVQPAGSFQPAAAPVVVSGVTVVAATQVRRAAASACVTVCVRGVRGSTPLCELGAGVSALADFCCVWYRACASHYIDMCAAVASHPFPLPSSLISLIRAHCAAASLPDRRRRSTRRWSMRITQARRWWLCGLLVWTPEWFKAKLVNGPMCVL